MGKSRSISQFQEARLAEWIGDFAKAEEIYVELASTEDGLGRLMRPTVENRRKRTEEHQHAVNKAKDRVQMFDPARLAQPKAVAEPVLARWEYRALVVAKSEETLRVEIRGYSKTDAHPHLHAPGRLEVPTWVVLDQRLEAPNAEGDADLFWLTVRNGALDVESYISVDRWGLLVGTALIPEPVLADALASIHTLLAVLGQTFDWQG